ncbi:MAG: hypothetical protein Q9222_002720 [Ikaeria aurantiellina]
MDHSRSLESLLATVDSCVDKLHSLEDRARPHRRFQVSATKRFLDQTRQEVNINFQSLATWKTSFSKVAWREESSLVADIARLLDSLDDAIASASHDLERRLRRRNLVLIDLLPGRRRRLDKKVAEAIKRIDDTIQKLQAQHGIVERAVTQKNQQSENADLLRGTDSYNRFSRFFNDLHLDGLQDIRSSALSLVWKNLPPLRVASEQMAGNADDPGDGCLYEDQQINEARSLLSDLYTAWSQSAHRTACEFPANLPDMAKICLVLTGMQRQNLFENFLSCNVLDSHLPLDKAKIEMVLGERNRNQVATFYTEQRRAVPRIWEEGQHLEIEEEEPLPLKPDGQTFEGSFGVVGVVQDWKTHQLYARKQQITNTVDRENDDARAHLRTETERLRHLRHPHVIQLVKSYQRGRAYGIILKPAATCDLEKLIYRYYENKWCQPYHGKMGDVLRPIFLNGFGCLSKGLAHIHNLNVRHKDIKPENILFERTHKQGQEPRLFWADFGLALDFSATGNSKTRSTGLFSARYAAPEILTSHTRLVSVSSTGNPLNLGQSFKNVQDAEVCSRVESELTPADETGHGRMTDIFSLGCVFLELLACLLNETYPMDRQGGQGISGPAQNLPRTVETFGRHIPELVKWAHQHGTSNHGHELGPLLRLAAKMIAEIPEKRPNIGDVIVKDENHHACCAFIEPRILEHIANADGISDEVRESVRSTIRESETTDKERQEVGDSDKNPHEPDLPDPEGEPTPKSDYAAPIDIFDSKNSPYATLPGPHVRRYGRLAVDDNAVDTCYDFVTTAREFFRVNFGWKSIDDKEMPIRATVRYGWNVANAYWMWTEKQMVFGNGNPCMFNFTGSYDVIGHELTHGIVQHSSGLKYEGMAGSLNESCADVIGSLLEHWVRGTRADEATWLIAEDVLFPNDPTIAMRSMKAPGTAYKNLVIGNDEQPAHMRDYVKIEADYMAGFTPTPASPIAHSTSRPFLVVVTRGSSRAGHGSLP